MVYIPQPPGFDKLGPETVTATLQGGHVQITDYSCVAKKLMRPYQMVEDLLRGFVHGEWLREVDFTTLERVNGVGRWQRNGPYCCAW